MRRGWKIVIAALVVLAVLLTLNTITVDNETKPAETTAEGAQTLELSSGDVQVVETPAEAEKPGAPIVLIHCYACSLHWWDAMVPLLSADHRVITIDLLGHGGSAKPSSGYSMEDQASVVAEALNELRVQGAVVVGHSLGASVATALAEQSSELVDRVVDIDAAPDTENFGQGSPIQARLGYVPVIGQLLNRVTPDFAVEDGYAEAFAPGYDVEGGFEDPDQVVDDFRDMTYTSFDQSHDAVESFTAEVPLDERLSDAAVPLLVIFGAEDQIADAEQALAGFQDVPGVRTATIEGAGGSPNVEQPEETAELILEFAADAGDEVLPPPEIGEAESEGGNQPGGGRPERKKDKRGKGVHERDENEPEPGKKPDGSSKGTDQPQDDDGSDDGGGQGGKAG